MQKIIYASSSSVYSDESSEPFNEASTLLKPKSLYGKSNLKMKFLHHNFLSQITLP